ncbi:unnamed protein product, partial [Rotaria sp. Silwood1]
VSEAVMDSTSMSKQSSFVDINSMREYIHNNNRYYSQYADYPFIDYDQNLLRVGVRQFTWDECIVMFKSDIFLRTHSPDKNKLMIEYFYSNFSKIGTANDININIEQIPFLMDQNNHLQLIKDIYFPAETIGDSGTSDSDNLFINKIIFDWLNEKTQKSIKQWLQTLGVIQRTDLTFLNKTVIPNASTYITSENALKTIKMLFMLFQKHDIEKKELNQLKKLKLLTTRGTLIAAEQCFFCDQYKPRLPLEEYLKAKEDKFLSFDYIRLDERNLKDNLDRIQMIYYHILKEIYFWSSDERKTMKTQAKSFYLLTENDQWKLANDLYLYMEGNGTNNNLNDAIPCLKLDYKNRNHSHLNQFLDLFNIKQIKMNDLKLVDKQSSPAEHFRRKLIEISPFLKKWLKNSSVSSDIISVIDKKIQQENDFIESDCLQLFYNQKFVQETNVYFDNKYKQLYVRRPWDSETTFIDLPNKLCQLLNIRGFEKNIRFLLKGTIEEIQKHFTTNSIEIPTKKDIVILERLSRSDILQQSKPSATPSPKSTETTTSPPESNKSTSSIKNKETRSNKHEYTTETTGTFIDNSANRKYNTDTVLALQQLNQGFPQYYPFSCSGNYVLMEIIA